MRLQKAMTETHERWKKPTPLFPSANMLTGVESGRGIQAILDQAKTRRDLILESLGVDSFFRFPEIWTPPELSKPQEIPTYSFPALEEKGIFFRRWANLTMKEKPMERTRQKELKVVAEKIMELLLEAKVKGGEGCYVKRLVENDFNMLIEANE